jgi:hypothetical protein
VIARHRIHRKFLRRRGVGLVELMISTAITAGLLVAVGAAYTATATGIESNDQFFRASQAARVSVNQVMNEVRKCQSGVVETDSLELTDSIGQKRLYSFDEKSGMLTMTFPDVETPTTYTLARNVQSAAFHTDGSSISLVVTVKNGKNAVTLSGSAIPRRVMTFN